MKIKSLRLENFRAIASAYHVFDGKNAACQAYVRQVREKYASGEYVKYLESAEDLKEYVPDFQERVKDFYEKYGE